MARIIPQDGVNLQSLKGANIMASQLIPVVSARGQAQAGLPAKQPRKVSEILMEAVVVLFFGLGPALGAALFLMWFGGLAWGLLSSLFR
jgi:hypothetical protein